MLETAVQQATSTIYFVPMARRIMYVQLKTGYDVDPRSIVDSLGLFLQDMEDRLRTRSNSATVAWHGPRQLLRHRDWRWVSGSPVRSETRTDERYSPVPPEIEDGARRPYERFLRGVHYRKRTRIATPSTTWRHPLLPHSARSAESVLAARRVLSDERVERRRRGVGCSIQVALGGIASPGVS